MGTFEVLYVYIKKKGWSGELKNEITFKHCPLFMRHIVVTCEKSCLVLHSSVKGI